MFQTLIYLFSVFYGLWRQEESPLDRQSSSLSKHMLLSLGIFHHTHQNPHFGCNVLHFRPITSLHRRHKFLSRWKLSRCCRRIVDLRLVSILLGWIFNTRVQDQRNSKPERPCWSTTNIWTQKIYTRVWV